MQDKTLMSEKERQTERKNNRKKERRLESERARKKEWGEGWRKREICRNARRERKKKLLRETQT